MCPGPPAPRPSLLCRWSGYSHQRAHGHFHGNTTSRAQRLSNRPPRPPLVALAQTETWILSFPTSGNPSHPPRPRSDSPTPTHTDTHAPDAVVLGHAISGITHPPHGAHHRSRGPLLPARTWGSNPPVGTKPPDSDCPADLPPPTPARGSPRPSYLFRTGSLFSS